jgi:uncharacterized protein YjiK
MKSFFRLALIALAGLGGASAATARAAAAAGDLPAATAVAVEGLREASGIAWNATNKRLYVVGDRGSLVELDPSGKPLHRWPVAGNLEDVAVHLPSGLLVLVDETKRELIVFDPQKGAESARVAIDAEALLGAEEKRSNLGFEGIAFRPDRARPGGGVFYLTHQSRPARLVLVQFDPAKPPRQLGADALVAHRRLAGWDDLRGITWCEPLGSLLVIARRANRLLLVSPEGEVQADVALPGRQREGLALTPDGALWMADDREGLFRIDGARAALAAVARQRSAR